MKKYEMDETCNTHGDNEECIHNFCRENPEIRGHVGDLRVDKKKI
jgi:hypothetical protein